MEKTGNDLRLLSATPVLNGQVIRLNAFGEDHEVLLPVIGDFQIWNSLCALGLVVGSGDKSGQAIAALSHITGVPGRLQAVCSTPEGGSVFVDYAHKPDALENVLKALRPHVARSQRRSTGPYFWLWGKSR